MTAGAIPPHPQRASLRQAIKAQGLKSQPAPEPRRTAIGPVDADMHRLHAALQGRVAPEREELLSKTASLRARQQVHVQMGGIAVRNRRRRRYGMMDHEGAPLV